jgi:hypothetical protein
MRFYRIYSYDQEGKLVRVSPGYSANQNLSDVIRVFRAARADGLCPALAMDTI